MGKIQARIVLPLAATAAAVLLAVILLLEPFGGDGNCPFDADLNGDSIVNSEDFGPILASWDTRSGEDGYDQRVDTDGNGVVNAGDFGVILACQ